MPRYERGWEYHCRYSGDFKSCRIRIFAEWCAYIILRVVSLKSVASTIIVVCGYGTITNKIRIMTARQIIYSSTIIVLGFFQSVPAFIMLASTNIIVILLGIFWGILLGIFWRSTIIGRWFFRELWRSTLRLENLILPGVWGTWKVR